MRTIPDPVLDLIVEHRPHLAEIVTNIRTHPDQAPQLELALARAYLHGETQLSPMDTWYLSQVAHCGPWGGDWCSLAEAADRTGYDESHLRRLAGAGKLEAIKRDRTWYVRRDTLPIK